MVTSLMITLKKLNHISQLICSIVSYVKFNLNHPSGFEGVFKERCGVKKRYFIAIEKNFLYNSPILSFKTKNKTKIFSIIKLSLFKLNFSYVR